MHGLATLFFAASVALLLTTPGVGPRPTRAAIVAETEDATFESGGLGLTLEDVHARYGTSEPDLLGEAFDVGNGRLIVNTAPNGKVDYVERAYNVGISFEDARFLALQLAPVDAVLVETYRSMADSTVDLYYSPSLATQFPPTMTSGTLEYDTWTNGEPGQFIVGYGGYNPSLGINEVTRTVMGLGNNP